MRLSASFKVLGALAYLALCTSAQSIDEMYSTPWDVKEFVKRSDPKIEFKEGKPVLASIDKNGDNPLTVGLNIVDSQYTQQMGGVGAGITDAVSIVLQDLKLDMPDVYDEIIHLLYSQSDEWIEKGGAGLNLARSPLGASDFSTELYSLEDSKTSQRVDLTKSKKLWQTLLDIQKVNPKIQFYFLLWSAPSWMKDNGKMTQGGHLIQDQSVDYEQLYAKYIVDALVGIDKMGIKPSYLSLQESPQHVDNVVPTMQMDAAQQARLAKLIKPMLEKVGLGDTKILTLEASWDTAEYAMKTYAEAGEVFSGVAWQGYTPQNGPQSQAAFTEKYPNAEVHFTEVTRVITDTPWNNLRNGASTILMGSIAYGTQNVLLWNAVLRYTDDQRSGTYPSLPHACKICQAPIMVFHNTLKHCSSTQKRFMLKGEKSPDYLALDSVQSLAADSTEDTTSSQLRIRGLRFGRDGKLGKRQSGDGTTPPNETSTYVKSSDFETLAHLSLAIRPRSASGVYGKRISSFTSEEVAFGKAKGRVMAQVFEVAVDENTSRFTCILFNWNDNNETVYEPVKTVISFRGKIAEVTTVPGLYTFSWEAESSKNQKRVLAPLEDIQAMARNYPH
ncbi:glycoside hydrolase [Violaceomyces palustris]|uniref:Glycoside hydrolase n=1 Tax=Violaceomyces palustris TaxID=1673888 RepID=A0ACD0P7H3_9BASI|nr:glycoside hydrolase [Violaceomyces palustris]